MTNVHNVMTITPDGLYYFYGELANAGFMSLRVFNSSGQIAIYTIATVLPLSLFSKVAISEPKSGIYTVMAIYSVNNNFSLEYYQFIL